MVRISALLVAAILLLAACTGQPAAAPATAPATESPVATAIPTPDPTPTPTEEPTPSPTPTPTPEPTPTPLPPSLTSGLPSGQEYRPINVQIENRPEARPQAGMSQADVVYEALMEGRSMTRFQCVFNDVHPKNVGPVRSCRLYFVDIAQEYKGLLAFFGGPSTTKADIYPKIRKAEKAQNIQLAVDGISGRYGTASKYGVYWRAKGKKAPHNVYSDLEKMSALFEQPVEPVSHFLFREDAGTEGDAISKIQIRYNVKTVDTLYVYDPVTRKYMRSVSGEPFTDANTNEQIAVTNVIVQYAKTTGLGTGHGHLNIKLVGTGKADVFVGGKHIAAEWKRDSEKDITRYFDKAGSEIALLPGNTWVQIVPDDKSVPVVFE